MPIDNSLSLIFHVACKSHNGFLGKAILYFCFIVFLFLAYKSCICVTQLYDHYEVTRLCQINTVTFQNYS